MATNTKGISTIGVIAIVAVLAIGGGVYVATQSDSAEEPAAESQADADAAATEDSEAASEADGDADMSGTASLRALLTRDESARCEVTVSDGETTVDGVLFTADGGERFRWDFTANQAGQTVESHVVRNGNTQYTWSEQMNQGMKMTFDPAMLAEDSSVRADDQGDVDYSQDAEYDCAAWSVDDSQFEPPADITFRSLDGMGGTPPYGSQ